MSLWADIDSYLETEVMAAMGPDGDYTTLQIKQARIDDYWQIDQVKKEELFPFSLFRSYEMTQALDGHDGNGLHTENTYPYVWVCATKSDGRRAAKVDAQEMLSRMRAFMRIRPVLNGLVSTDATERLAGLTPGKGSIEVIGRLDKEASAYYGMAILFFVIETNN